MADFLGNGKLTIEKELTASQILENEASYKIGIYTPHTVTSNSVKYEFGKWQHYKSEKYQIRLNNLGAWQDGTSIKYTQPEDCDGATQYQLNGCHLAYYDIGEWQYIYDSEYTESNLEVEVEEGESFPYENHSEEEADKKYNYIYQISSSYTRFYYEYPELDLQWDDEGYYYIDDFGEKIYVDPSRTTTVYIYSLTVETYILTSIILTSNKEEEIVFNYKFYPHPAEFQFKKQDGTQIKSGDKWLVSEGLKALIVNFDNFEGYARQWNSWNSQKEPDPFPSWTFNAPQNRLTADNLNNIHEYVGTGNSYSKGQKVSADMFNSLAAKINGGRK